MLVINVLLIITGIDRKFTQLSRRQVEVLRRRHVFINTKTKFRNKIHKSC